MAGRLSEFVATVEKVDPDQRVWVLLELMGRTMRVAVHSDALRVVWQADGRDTIDPSPPARVPLHFPENNIYSEASE